jgi:hypothetical protein
VCFFDGSATPDELERSERSEKVGDAGWVARSVESSAVNEVVMW